ncbi:MAG: CoA-binding protein [Micropruina sp.]
MTGWQDARTVDFMLDECRTWAVVGCQAPTGPSTGSRRLLQARGKRIVPVHPSAPTVLGEPGYATLAEIPFPVDVVDVFRRSEQAGTFADQAVEIGSQGVWFQLGVIDEDVRAHERGGRPDGDGHVSRDRVASPGVDLVSG